MNTPRVERDSLLAVRGLSRSTADGIVLLDRVSVTLEPSDRLFVSGGSGAGKTLLLRAIALLDPLNEGEVVFRGRKITSEGVPDYRRTVMYVPQQAALLGDTVEADLSRPFSLGQHEDRSFARERVSGWLAALGRSEEFLAKWKRDLSGGEMQIVALLRALQLDPVVLLLDEPTASLDRETELQVEALLQRWLTDAPSERALVWVAHDRRQLERVGTAELAMAEGRGRIVDGAAQDAPLDLPESEHG